jgi:hypothetical protein
MFISNDKVGTSLPRPQERGHSTYKSTFRQKCRAQHFSPKWTDLACEAKLSRRPDRIAKG